MKTLLILTALIQMVGINTALAESNPAEWPVLYNANHSAFSATTVLKPPLKVKWAAKINSVVQNPGPVVAEGCLVVNDAQGYLHCLDAETGELKWRFFQKQIGYGGGASSPTIWNGRVYCAFFSRAWPTLGGMHCFDLKTGELLWKEKRAGLLGTRIKFSPQVSKGKLFYISNVKANPTAWDVDNSGYKAQVQCWDALTGDSLWIHNVWESRCQNTTILVVGDTV
ncbi:MAG: PQQ-like beta-propeller repeat protein [Fibrobacteres bacterium]|nr:PQQ-like beta-propeller repeat protein [Fibrobacterota bacterium]